MTICDQAIAVFRPRERPRERPCSPRRACYPAGLSSTRQIRTLADALALMGEIGAPARLLRHAELASEAAENLLALLERERVALDAAWVRAGAALHDVGKIEHVGELSHPGAQHEPAGERLLLAHGVAPHVARCCRSHAQWATLECALEELVVALADKLWKGARVPALEQRVIEAAAGRCARGVWDLFVSLDNGFEAIADAGPARIARSHVA